MTMIHQLAGRLRNWASGPRVRTPRWTLHREMYEQSTYIVTFFYIATAFFLYDGSRNLSDLAVSLDSLDLLWPVAWIREVGVHTGGRLIAQFGIIVGLLGIVAWRARWVRILVSLAVLLHAAYENSHGAMSHGYHEWFWVSVCFWLLPSGSKAAVGATRAGRMHFLTAFSAAPLLILFFYTLSGVYKCWYAMAAVIAGQSGGFSPDAMAITVAWRAIQTGSQPLWGSFILDHPLLGWPFYAGLYFVELVSVLVFFRPNLHRTWGIVLIAFHFGTLLFMDIVFSRHILINGLLFVMSPFALGEHAWRHQIVAVPVFGRLAAMILGRPGIQGPKSPAANAPGAAEPHSFRDVEPDTTSAPARESAEAGRKAG